jgi:hypothetical protein
VGLVVELAGGAPEHHGAGGNEVTLAGDVVLPLGDLHVEPAVHLEDHELAARQPPQRVDVASAASRVDPGSLPVGDRESVVEAHPNHTHLGDGMGTLRDPGQRALERLGPAQRAHPVDLRDQPLGGGESLLDDRRQQPVRRTTAALVRGEQQGRGLGPPGREAAGGVEADRPARLDEAHPGHRRQVVRLGQQHRDLLARPALQAASFQSRQPTDRAARAGVENAGPHALFAGQHAGRRTDHDVAHQLPAPGCHVSIEVLVVVAERIQLATSDESALARRDRGPGAGADTTHVTSLGRSGLDRRRSSTGLRVVRLSGCSCTR